VEGSISHTRPALNIAPLISTRPGVDQPAEPTDKGSHTGSLSGRLKKFAQRILKKATTPLLQSKVHDSSSAKLPLRSRRIAAQPLSKVPVAKRGEVLVMQRLGLIQARPTEAEKQEYEDMFVGNLGSSHAEAIRELFPDEVQLQRPRRRRGSRA
jgi:hypothetical protein